MSPESKDAFDAAGVSLDRIPQLAMERRPKSLLEVIADAVSNPLVDVEKMRALFELQKDIQAEERKVTYESAMAQLQSKIPLIEKNGTAKNSKYARYEDMHVAIQPLLHDYGFNVSFDEESHTDKTVTFVMKVSHEDGHSELKRLTVPIDAASKNRDGNAIRPAIQDSGSTVSYARRYLYKMHFNIVEKGEDTDGNSQKAITPEECAAIRKLIAETKSDEAVFLELIAGVKAIEEIPARDYKRVVNALETKKRMPRAPKVPEL